MVRRYVCYPAFSQKRSDAGDAILKAISLPRREFVGWVERSEIQQIYFYTLDGVLHHRELLQRGGEHLAAR